MKEFEEKSYKVFDMFSNHWALATAGNIKDFNTCVIGWGSLGNIWGSGKTNKPIVTVYIHPARYTSEYMRKYDTFTVSFYPKEYRRALGYLGTHSGRDGDKITPSGLTPVSFGDGVTFKETELTFLCRKIYQNQFSKEGLADDIKEYYAANPKLYPSDSADGWQPHYMFIGEILEVEDKQG